MKCMKCRNFRDRLLPFTSGMAAMAMLMLMVIPSSAAGGQVAYNQVGIRTFGEQRVTAGESYTAPDGQQVPSSITYIDAAGKMTNYLSIRQLSELLDAAVDWSAASNSVEIAAPKSGGEVVVSTGEAAEAEKTEEALEPEYGKVIGALEEINPASVEKIINNQEYRTRNTARDMRVQFSLSDFPGFTLDCLSYAGPYVVFSVTNNGPRTVYSEVRRFVTISYGEHEDFTRVAIPSGSTLVRVFRILDDAHPLQTTFEFDVDASVDLDPRENDITLSLLQYSDVLE